MTNRKSEPIRVVLVEDHTIVREGLRALLEGPEDIQVVGEAEDGREAVEVARRIKPEIVVMDLAMPGLNGVDATRQIRKQSPATRVLVLSMHSGEEYVRPAIRAGASGFLVKGAGLSDLVAAIRALAAGEAFFSPAAAKVVLQDASTAKGRCQQSAWNPLTGRECEVLQLVAEGKSSKEIGHLLHISTKTVEGHRSRIMEKLDIHDLAGLVRYAIRVRLISVEK